MITWEQLGIDEGAKKIVRQRPTVHELCTGGFLRETTQLEKGLWAIPLQPLGSDDLVNFIAQYAREIVGVQFDATATTEARLKGLISAPVVALVCAPNRGSGPEELEASARPRLELARQVISCAVVQHLIPFAVFTHTTGSQGFFRLLTPEHSRARNRILSFMNLETPALMSSVFAKASADEHYRFALALLNDAVAESSARFRIARFFNVLECLAAENKSSDIGSRKAVRILLGFPRDGDIRDWEINSVRYSFDIIELAGRLRDKLFHGVPFRPEDLAENVRPSYHLLEEAPFYIADTLTEYCKAALYGDVIGQMSDAGPRGA